MRLKVIPVDRPRQQVEQQLREAILTSVLPAGTRLPSETELAKEFHVSRPTVREALRALAADGLISTQRGAGGGSFVGTVDHKSFAATLSDSMNAILKLGRVTHEEVGSVREMLEVPAARLAASHATPDQIAELQRIYESETEFGLEESRLLLLDVQFHQLISDATGNRVLSALFSALVQIPNEPTLLDFAQKGPDVQANLHAQHEALLAALRAQDPEAAERAMAEHIAYFHSVVRGPVPAHLGAKLESGIASVEDH
ncbi:FadR/GntR family transcriptional regulator [Nocardia miyunensis]|uniref:FadR/GntR family transcriptional regulator n=1 Tax=Nocardia miyunensis TaxID=282684 RepID=UPI0008326DD0|nr:FadR/GntR family transcriptional regulator [Nocardia miyunensis]